MEDRAIVCVEDGKGRGFTVEKVRGDMPIVKMVALPFGKPVDTLHVRLGYQAMGLRPGKEKWKDGRLILDWVDKSGQVVAHDTLVTLQGNDKKTRSAEMIVRSMGPELVPVLRVEHLGLSGRMEIRSLQAIAVRERGWVIWVTAGLLGVWGLWCYGFVRLLTKATRARVLGVTAILLLMGWFLVVPGPWAHDRPLVGDFQIGAIPDAMERKSISLDSGTGQEVEPLDKMPTQGSWLYKVKRALSFLRPVLHVMLFAVPAFVIAALGGMRCAWWSGVLVSCAVEAGQTGFGFGFDWLDGIDLLVDWAGIAVAIWAWGRVGERTLNV